MHLPLHDPAVVPALRLSKRGAAWHAGKICAKSGQKLRMPHNDRRQTDDRDRGNDSGVNLVVW